MVPSSNDCKCMTPMASAVVTRKRHDLGINSSPSCSARPWLAGGLRDRFGLSEGGASVSKFRLRRARRLGVLDKPGVRPTHWAGPGEGVTLQKSAKEKS